ncbi:hypothetical protein L6164_033151 [Bauhinia variegata]|uniref:Uncharacterized protein n=1 Tax=Bauhinia variegata TaxID=167791 RepID=A0ACB9KRK5_BAUVA|nr:hypothetical protein L6164_033151 [Bauhinia variegata]
MEFSNSKPLLLFIFSLMLLNNVSSQSPSPSRIPFPETVGFGFSFSKPKDFSAIVLEGDASIAGGALQLTKKDNQGNPIKDNVGRAQYRKPVHLWDKTTGNLADFSPQTAINNTNTNQVVAIEFDTHMNEWDPISTNDNHIGIGVNSIHSAVVSPWLELDQGIVYANINYNSESKRLSVSLSSRTFPDKTFLVSDVVDLRTVLPEWVRVGFSASTGQLVETHDVFNWSFYADL